jgi:hypothetical protein
MHNAFGWSPEQFIYSGGYPGSALLISDEERWKDYIRESLVETTISKDILMMTRVDKPTLLKMPDYYPDLKNMQRILLESGRRNPNFRYTIMRCLQQVRMIRLI